MKNKIIHLLYMILSLIPDIYFFDRYLKRMRTFILSLESNKLIGKNVDISGYTKIWSSTILQIGNNVKIKNNVTLSGNITIGDNSVIMNHTYIDGSGKVFIGNYCSIGSHCFIYSHTHEIYDKNSKVIYSKDKYEEVIIGDDAMLFDKVSVMSGVNIKNGTVVAHAGVVTKNTSEYGIYAGIPAKLINERK
jgi:dTDP-4-amino-4,6-dideoxy-D-glucose acyltransferase